MADRVAEIVGDYRAFAARRRDRLAVRGIDITPYRLGHLGGAFDGFRHVEEWVPQRIVTATGPNPVPRRPTRYVRPGGVSRAVA